MSISKVIASFTPDEKSEAMKRKLTAICLSSSQENLNNVYNNIRTVFPEYLYNENFVIQIDGKTVPFADPQKFTDSVKGLKSLDIKKWSSFIFLSKKKLLLYENKQKKVKDKKLQVMNGTTLIFEFTPKYANDANEAIIKDIWKKNWNELQNKVLKHFRLMII
ncbi:hypothetical protein RFI_05154 [Reticulomyxa filosa]|uniref:Uncharacterized protein n=1 Tax=Reticulomyxa filosa TaxID=46433 RepID=X6P1E7_RETFI|nr:hypothetical protein RFI_05154 [Reticulomyxa filosa]|eukprot:ETO31963.1 hypothetical protein RFI_05154 [Reticulomyxa filosa]